MRSSPGDTARRLALAAGLAWAILAAHALAAESGEPAKASARKPYSPYAGGGVPTRVWFGDTHLHTSFSMDAGAFGARLGPRDAYRFARGEEVTASSGQPVRLSRPLDFLMVADHSDNMGFFPDLFAGKPEVLADPTGKRWYDMIQSGRGEEAAREIIVAFSQGTFPKALMYLPGTRAYQGAWQETIAAAEHYNEPGRFTAFIGYEWTSNTGGNNLHRNVVFLDGSDKASQVEPFTVYPPLGSDDPRDLWKWMAAYERKTGGRVLAIAHNGNLSNGRMFPLIESFTGNPSTSSTPCSARSGSGSTRRRRPRATARRIRSSRPTTSSPPSSAGTRATSTAAPRRRRTCSSSSTSARRTRTASRSRSGSGRTRTSSASSAAPTPTPA
jgi:hypothetical protein